MHTPLKSLLVLLLCVGISSAAYGGQWIMKTFQAKSYSGSRDRQYQMYVSDAYQEGEPVPIVMVLHGCRQTEQNMIDETRFSEFADQENFIVVYPVITSYDGSRNPNCWGFFLDQHIHEGAGEAEDLYQIALEVESEYTIDPERRYITGLSSGAGMSVVMAVAQSEYFAAAGAAAGLPYSETSSSVGFVCFNPGTFKSIPAVVAAMQAEQRRPEEARAIPLMTIHSNNDCTVNRQGSVNLRDAWIQHYGASPNAYETTDCAAEGVPCTYLKFGAPNRSVVETVFYEGERGSFTGEGSHYWVGDHSGQFANPKGPSATELFWDFFKRHGFSDNLPPSISIASGSAEGTSINLTGTASDADGTVAEVSVALNSKNETFETTVSLERRDSGIVDWSARSDSLPGNAFYTPLSQSGC
jgi:poly(hydroxyalkanoate) depolymerase family esterase